MMMRVVGSYSAKFETGQHCWANNVGSCCVRFHVALVNFCAFYLQYLISAILAKFVSFRPFALRGHVMSFL